MAIFLQNKNLAKDSHIYIYGYRLCQDIPKKTKNDAKKHRPLIQASSRIELLNHGFADRSLTTWVRRRVRLIYKKKILMSSLTSRLEQIEKYLQSSYSMQNNPNIVQDLGILLE